MKPFGELAWPTLLWTRSVRVYGAASIAVRKALNRGLHVACTLFVLLYDCEAWTLVRGLARRIEAFTESDNTV